MYELAEERRAKKSVNKKKGTVGEQRVIRCECPRRRIVDAYGRGRHAERKDAGQQVDEISGFARLTVPNGRLQRIADKKDEIEDQREEKERSTAFVRARLDDLLVVVVIVEPDEKNSGLNENGQEEEQERADVDEKEIARGFGQFEQPVGGEVDVEAEQQAEGQDLQG